MTDSSANSYRILVVDDSLSLLDGVRTALRGAGFQPLTAVSGEEALELIGRSGLPHLALVDINMPPGMDGLEFCEEVHAYCDLPVIMLTAVGEEETIVQVLEQHAEDYITKPFRVEELLARVRRVLRSLGDFACPLEPGAPIDRHLQVNFPGCYVTVDGNQVALTPTEMRLLYILMRSAGKTLTTEFILRRLWPLEAPNEANLRVYVHRLRNKIEATEPEHRYIIRERGVGYSFIPSAPAASSVADSELS